MGEIESYFATKVYRVELGGGVRGRLRIAEIERACRSLAADDTAGQHWCDMNRYPGYTSYASLDDLPTRFPEFASLVPLLDEHVAAFARALEYDLGHKRMTLDSLWVNVLPPGGYHTSHIHPNAAISGTCYVAVPKGASALKLEDPRLPLMMAAPPRKASASRSGRPFVSIEPKAGTVLLWESFVRHEVPVNEAPGERISVSFNYRWG